MKHLIQKLKIKKREVLQFLIQAKRRENRGGVLALRQRKHAP